MWREDLCMPALGARVDHAMQRWGPFAANEKGQERCARTSSTPPSAAAFDLCAFRLADCQSGAGFYALLVSNQVRMLSVMGMRNTAPVRIAAAIRLSIPMSSATFGAVAIAQQRNAIGAST